MNRSYAELRAVAAVGVNAGKLKACVAPYGNVQALESGAFVEVLVWVPNGVTLEMLAPPKPNGSGEDESIA